MNVVHDSEQGVNYNKYDTGKNSREGQQKEMVEESIEKIKPPNPNNIIFHG
jgi:ATP-dependent phosphoenolpyruvate carboxykinase